MSDKEKSFTRMLQITIPQESHVLLARLILRRTEQEHPPSKTTKSAVIGEAIWKLAESEGLTDTVLPTAPEASKL